MTETAKAPAVKSMISKLAEVMGAVGSRHFASPFEARIQEADPMTETAKAPAVKSMISKLAEVMGAVDWVPKDGKNTFHGYNYSTEAAIVAAVRKEMATRSLLLVPTVKTVEWSTATTNSGKAEKICTLMVTFTIHDGENGTTLAFDVLGQGQDSGDKASYKAMTGATKYALLKLFLIPTGHDPEDEPAKAPQAPAGADKLRAQASSPKAPSASPPRRPQIQDEPPPHSDNDAPPSDEPTGRTHQAVTFRFGLAKGKSSYDASDADLAYYCKAAQAVVDDASKERFKAANMQELACLQAEQRWRAEGR